MKIQINRKNGIKLSFIASLLLASAIGLTSLSEVDANDQTEFRLRNASRVSSTSAFAIKDALATDPTEGEPENPGESVECGENGSECKAKGKENTVFVITGKRE